MDVSSRDRSVFSYLPGDLFEKNNVQEFTILHLDDRAVYGALKDENGIGLKKYPNLTALMDDGFEPNQEYLEVEKEILEKFSLYAPRRLEDGTWAALTRLVATTAICVNYDADGMGISMYESRYCFSNTQVLPHYGNASYWLAQLKNQESLPVGNCAFRGRLGTEPLLDMEYTRNYYAMMAYLYEEPSLEGLNIQQVADMVMREVLDEFLPAHLKATKSLKVPEGFTPRYQKNQCLFI